MITNVMVRELSCSIFNIDISGGLHTLGSSTASKAVQFLGLNLYNAYI